MTSQIPPCPLYVRLLSTSTAGTCEKHSKFQAIKRILTLEAVYAFFGGSLILSYLSTVGTCEVGFGYRTVDTKFISVCYCTELPPVTKIVDFGMPVKFALLTVLSGRANKEIRIPGQYLEYFSVIRSPLCSSIPLLY
ncbi:unnamed protein product [Somion occarium]|uniref:Uncharacterized protein n=1 Tax=Somion occarium TaxID=3059160 RepID=A0ABP1E4D6_9APHY